MENKNEQILKKEDKLTYWKGFLNGKKGSLVLSTSELYFIFQGKNMFTIPVPNILSVNCQKGFGTGNENMYVIYTDAGKEKKVKIQHTSFMSLATIGNLSRLGAFYFSSWEQSINDARKELRT